VLAFGDGCVAAYDPTPPGSWHFVESQPGPDGHWAVKAWDPVNRRAVVFPQGGMVPTLFGGSCTWARAGGPVAFDPDTGAWIPLHSP
jgi:hypothetical protein